MPGISSVGAEVLTRDVALIYKVICGGGQAKEVDGDVVVPTGF